MSVDMFLVAEIDKWLTTLEVGHGRGLGMDNLENVDHWKNLSKSASYILPSLLGSSLKHIRRLRDELVRLQADPPLVATQKQVIDLQAELLQ